MSQHKSRLSEYHQPLWLDLIHRLLKWPRFARIVLVAIFALAATLAVSPLVDTIYLTYFFTEETRLLPSLISAGIGLASYFVGWWLVIGSVGETPPARRAILLYIILGIIVIGLLVALTLSGLSSANAPTIE